MRFRVALLAAVGLTVSAGAYAQTPGAVDGWFVHLGVGYNYLESVPVGSVNFNNGSQVAIDNKSINYVSGITGEIGPGYGFGNGFSLQLDGTGSYNDVNQNGGGRTCTNNCPYTRITLHSGDERKFGTFLAGIYDFTDAFGPGITPFVGAGVGFQNIRQNDVRVTGVFQGGPYDHDGWQLTGSSSKTTFAYDGLAGVKFRLDSVDPNLSLYLEGRYLGTSGTRTYTATFQTVGYKAQHNVSLGNEGNESAIIGV